MQKKIIKFLSVTTIVILVFNAWMYTQQPGMTFFPHAKLLATPIDWGLGYEDVVLTTFNEVKIHGWFVPAINSTQVILFFHGNGGNISHRGESLKIFHSLGFNVLIIDYQGYGKSQGVMSEKGSYHDAMAAWQYLIKERHFKADDIIIFGRSLGGAIATQLATKVNQKALIIESTFSSVNDMASVVLPFISKLVYLRYDYNTEKIINQIDSPLLLMHSQNDDIVPYELGEKVFVAAKSPKYFFELQGGHNGGFTQDVVAYKQAITWFISGNKQDNGT